MHEGYGKFNGNDQTLFRYAQLKSSPYCTCASIDSIELILTQIAIAIVPLPLSLCILTVDYR